VGDIVRFKKVGNVDVKKLPRGEGTTGFKITCKGSGERATFGLRIYHRVVAERGRE
jgi:hypothetical protein